MAKKWQISKRSFRQALRAFTLSVGVTAVGMLATAGLLGLAEPEARQAAAFQAQQAPPAERAAPAEAAAQENQVVLLGQAFGVKLFTDGVIVASLSDIYSTAGVCCPAEEAGLRPGDYLLEADGMEIQSNAALAHYIGQSQGREVRLKVRREDREFEAVVRPVFGDGAFKTGMWVRDSAAGVGTLTFYDPASAIFAGLGHGICDADVGSLMPLKAGEPARITLCGVVKGMPESPGQLRGYFTSDEPMGRLLANNETGVYGSLAEAPAGETVEVLERDEVKPGPVEILASIDSGGPRRYSARIEKRNGEDQLTKNLVLKVTDPRLLEATGGIVQGM